MYVTRLIILLHEGQLSLSDDVPVKSAVVSSSSCLLHYFWGFFFSTKEVLQGQRLLMEFKHFPLEFKIQIYPFIQITQLSIWEYKQVMQRTLH